MEIRIRGVSKSFAGIPALGPLSLTFATGRTHVILGASDSGKSTLAQIIGGILSADEGEVLIAGTRQDRVSQALLAEQIGYVAEDGGLFSHLSVRENITLKARLLGWKPEKILLRLTALSCIVGVGESQLSRFPEALSSAQRQRVSLMRALMLDPPILLMDEPLGALDPLVRHALSTELQVIFTQLQKTVILVTHDLNQAMLLGHSVTLLHHGRIIQQGSISDLLENPAHPFASEFVQAQRPSQRVQEIAA